jgi:hypothetical protein
MDDCCAAAVAFGIVGDALLARSPDIADQSWKLLRGWLGSNERLPLCTQSRQRSKMLDLRMLVSLTG